MILDIGHRGLHRFAEDRAVCFPVPCGSLVSHFPGASPSSPGHFGSSMANLGVGAVEDPLMPYFSRFDVTYPLVI